MSLEFHDGTHQLYKNYSTKAWNNEGLLQLNSRRSTYDKWLMENFNTEEKITELLGGEGVKNCYPFGEGKSKLSEYIAAEGTGIIVIKGLHQWERKENRVDYRLHITLGFEAQLWHLYAGYYARNDRISFSTTCTAGDRVTGESHDGFIVVGRS